MKKVFTFCLGALFTVAIAGTTLAAEQKKNLPDPSTLATIIPGGCTLFPESPESSALYVSWGWEGGTVQTKFGGDAIFSFTGSVSVPDLNSDGTPTGEFNPFPFDVEEVKIEISRHPGNDELEAYPEDYAGKLLYWCEPSEDATSEEALGGDCIGILKDAEQSVFNALMDKFEYPIESFVIEGALYPLEMVNVKAMNPGKKGRQNYSLSNEFDICVETAL